MSGRTDTERKYSPEIKDLTQRIYAHFQAGYDRWDADDMRCLASMGLMVETTCQDPFEYDSLEEGETMWVFTQAGKNLAEGQDQ